MWEMKLNQKVEKVFWRAEELSLTGLSFLEYQQQHLAETVTWGALAASPASWKVYLLKEEKK